MARPSTVLATVRVKLRFAAYLRKFRAQFKRAATVVVGVLGVVSRFQRTGDHAAAPRPAATRPNAERIRRMAIAMRRGGSRMAPGTGGDTRSRGDDDPRMALAPTIPGPRLTAKVPERARRGVPWHTCIIDAWGVKTEAAPGGQDGRIGSIDVREIDVGEPGGGEPPRRLSGGHCGAECARQCRADCAGIGAVRDALMRSMVQRRVTRQRNGAATAPKAEARSAMPEASGAVRAEANAPAIGEVPGSKSGAGSAPSGARRRARREARARMRRCRATDVRKRKRAAPPPPAPDHDPGERRRGPRCAAD